MASENDIMFAYLTYICKRCDWTL